MYSPLLLSHFGNPPLDLRSTHITTAKLLIHAAPKLIEKATGAIQKLSMHGPPKLAHRQKNQAKRVSRVLTESLKNLISGPSYLVQHKQGARNHMFLKQKDVQRAQIPHHGTQIRVFAAKLCPSGSEGIPGDPNCALLLPKCLQVAAKSAPGPLPW